MWLNADLFTYFFQISWNNIKIIDLIRETNKANFHEREGIWLLISV